jgi:primosomal protein N' (replication factor Y)
LCPSCRSFAIKYFGTGTQRVEEELKKLVDTKYAIGRMDKDTTTKPDSHDQIYEGFADKNVDILIGTQMITKGWDFPNIGLVGIISADTMINFPDYNAQERTFDLLTQVAGRTGRGNAIGEVVLQTYNPDNLAIKYASKHDFVGFYNKDILNRQEFDYPPFAHLIKIMYNSKSSDTSEEEMNKLFERIKLLFNNTLNIIGPSPAFIPKKAGRYWWQLIIKTDEKQLIDVINKLSDIMTTDWIMDVDPIGMI